MAVPTPHRRAFSQIQNTLSKSKATIGKNVNVREESGPSGAKENVDQLTPAALKGKEADLIEKALVLDFGETPEKVREEKKPDVGSGKCAFYEFFNFFRKRLVKSR